MENNAVLDIASLAAKVFSYLRTKGVIGFFYADTFGVQMTREAFLEAFGDNYTTSFYATDDPDRPGMIAKATYNGETFSCIMTREVY